MLRQKKFTPSVNSSMNELQKLIKIRGMNIRQLAKELRLGYHSLQKTVKGKRNTKRVLEALAAYFQV
jgi:hypothetical protein